MISEKDVRIIFDCGGRWVTIGSMAVKNETEFVNWLQEFGADKFILGADVKNEKIAIHGWTETTDIWVYDFVQNYIERGIQQVFCTDVAHDGLLQGPSLDLYKSIVSKFPALYFIASGGVSGLQDLDDLRNAGCKGVIVGKAIYEGRIQLSELSTF